MIFVVTAVIGFAFGAGDQYLGSLSLPAALAPWTGPGFGLLGQRWRVSRSWSSAALVAGAFLLEPVARRIDGRLFGPSWAWRAEVTLGACLVVCFLVAGTARRPSGRTV